MRVWPCCCAILKGRVMSYGIWVMTGCIVTEKTAKNVPVTASIAKKKAPSIQLRRKEARRGAEIEKKMIIPAGDLVRVILQGVSERRLQIC